MKTYQVTGSQSENESNLPIVPKGARTLNFSYFTLCKIQSVIKYMYPNAESMAMWINEKAQGGRPHVLTIDDRGNFVSLLPVA